MVFPKQDAAAELLSQPFARTDSGDARLLRPGDLERRHVTVLRLLDGHVRGEELADHLRNFDLPTILADLLAADLIVSTARVEKPGRGSARWTLSGLIRGGRPASRPDVAPDAAPASSGPADAASGSPGEQLDEPAVDADATHQAADAPTSDVDAATDTEDASKTSRFSQYVTSALDDDDITDIMGKRRNG